MSKRTPSILAVVTILLGVGNSLMWVWQTVRAAPSSSPGVPQLIGYQGRLTDPSGVPLTGEVDMRFCLYDVPSEGSALWCEQATVPVSYGVFSVLMGSVTPIPDTLFGGTALYLGVKVGADAEMTPRRRVVSVGYAYRAEEAATATYATTAGSADTCSTAAYAASAGSADLANFADDADTIDGVHAAGLAAVDHEHDASEISSGTMPPERISGTAWTASNDGAESGLDADLLDGRHLNQVTGLVAYGTAASGLAVRIINSPLFLILALGTLGLVFFLSARIDKIRASTASALFVGYSVLNGLFFSTIFLRYTSTSIASTRAGNARPRSTDSAGWMVPDASTDLPAGRMIPADVVAGAVAIGVMAASGEEQPAASEMLQTIRIRKLLLFMVFSFRVRQGPPVYCFQ